MEPCTAAGVGGLMNAWNRAWLWGIAGAVVMATPALAQQSPAVERGIAYLRAASASEKTGETAMAALAMIKAEVPLDDPILAACMARIDGRFNGSTYKPERDGGTEIYEAAVIIMAMANFDANGRKSQIDSAAKFIASRQKANGSWDYTGRTAGDTSISQYAILGLWEAENAGIEVNPAIWDRAAQWFLSTQSSQGSWNYHRDEPHNPETIAMTAAGTGSLLICQQQLATYKREVTAQNPYLTPIAAEGKRARYTVETPNARMSQGANGGLAWISKNFGFANAATVGQSPYYALYGIERIGALAGRDSLGKVDWYDQGTKYLVSKQAPSGVWTASHGDVPNTAWGVLFLTKSTAKTVERIRVRKRLGAGELYGGKGLPADLSTISEAGGRLIARPMDGAVEGMLTVLEDPRSENADSALAGLLARYQAQGPAALRPYRDRFVKLLSDKDQGVRRVAAWAIGRMADLGNAPALIAALRDPDETVVQEAFRSLQLLGRKIEGYGPPDPSTPEQREAASRAWRVWYDSVRPIGGEPGDLPAPKSARVGP